MPGGPATHLSTALRWLLGLAALGYGTVCMLWAFTGVWVHLFGQAPAFYTWVAGFELTEGDYFTLIDQPEDDEAGAWPMIGSWLWADLVIGLALFAVELGLWRIEAWLGPADTWDQRAQAFLSERVSILLVGTVVLVPGAFLLGVLPLGAWIFGSALDVRAGQGLDPVTSGLFIGFNAVYALFLWSACAGWLRISVARLQGAAGALAAASLIAVVGVNVAWPLEVDLVGFRYLEGADEGHSEFVGWSMDRDRALSEAWPNLVAMRPFPRPDVIPAGGPGEIHLRGQATDVGISGGGLRPNFTAAPFSAHGRAPHVDLERRKTVVDYPLEDLVVFATTTSTGTVRHPPKRWAIAPDDRWLARTANAPEASRFGLRLALHTEEEPADWRLCPPQVELRSDAATELVFGGRRIPLSPAPARQLGVRREGLGTSLWVDGRPVAMILWCDLGPIEALGTDREVALIALDAVLP